MTRKASVAHRVDAAMDAPKAIRLIGTGDMTLRKSQLTQLAERDDPVLRFGQLRQLSMRTHFSPHTGDKGGSPMNSPLGTSVRLSRIVTSGCL
jgi:hypothetical protein